MTIEAILAQIDSEIAKLNEARLLLSSGENSSRAVTSGTSAQVATKSSTRKRRVLSVAARKRIADAQHKRWAAQKKAAKVVKEAS